MTGKDASRSVRDRLLNLARARERPFQEILQYYAMERFLYRLSASPHRSAFVLKGALLLHALRAPLSRATKDIDLLGRASNSLENVERILSEVCEAEVEQDGMVFDKETVRVTRIKEDAEYEGARARFVGHLGTARVSMQVDIGFGDIVTPVPSAIKYPVLLDFPEAELLGYPRETVVSEKFQAMTYLGTLNSRMKDFYDIWLLANQFDFDGGSLTKAVSATFANRETAIEAMPIALTPEFFEQPSTVAQWSAFRSRLVDSRCPESLKELVELLCRFLLPVARASAAGAEFKQSWRAGGSWTSESRGKAGI